MSLRNVKFRLKIQRFSFFLKEFKAFILYFKQISGILCICNSGLNFIIYGLMNSNFRKGYRRFYVSVFYSITEHCECL